MTKRFVSHTNTTSLPLAPVAAQCALRSTTSLPPCYSQSPPIVAIKSVGSWNFNKVSSS